MPTYSASQIVGKSLIARQTVPIKRQPSKSAPTVYTATPGTFIGVVYSWVTEGPDLYWQFLDENGKPYYTLHKPGLYSIDALQDQGALTVQEQTEQEQGGGSVIDKVVKSLGNTANLILLGIGAAAVYSISRK